MCTLKIPNRRRCVHNSRFPRGPGRCFVREETLTVEGKGGGGVRLGERKKSQQGEE